MQELIDQAMRQRKRIEINLDDGHWFRIDVIDAVGNGFLKSSAYAKNGQPASRAITIAISHITQMFEL
jgi:hypothetical protein